MTINFNNNELPSQIGGYKIESLLNKGRMSLLYLGVHPETHEPLTIKVLSSKYVSHPEMVERFMREAEIIELTDHPNIVKLYGHGKWEGGVYIAMEFVQGISLRQMILQQAMSLKRALEISLQIAHALTHLHAHGIIHRDLKPENILLTAQGGVKVIDFGISQIYTTNKKPEPSYLVGTPVYMSPEQRKDPLSITFSTDIYSLAIVTYELVLGRLCYGEIHLSIVSRGLQKILAKALQPDPKDRYEDIVDFIKDVSNYLTSDELKRDRRGSDYLGELNEDLKEAQNLLIPTKLPNWPRVEMALASNCNNAISSVYYDFFKGREGVYHVVMGESLATAVEGLLQIAILKGMVHALAPIIDRPTDFVSSLNNRIYDEGRNRTFSFSLLTLFPSENRFSYISCGYSPLWHLPTGANAPRRLIADNPPLGFSKQMEIIEVDSNWKVGDTLVLHTFQAGQSKHVEEIELDENQFLKALLDNLFLSPQKQVDAIFRQISRKEGRTFFARPVNVTSIERIA
ncbi:MAG: protein kinase [Chlamydiales bacterium]